MLIELHVDNDKYNKKMKFSSIRNNSISKCSCLSKEYKYIKLNKNLEISKQSVILLKNRKNRSITRYVEFIREIISGSKLDNNIYKLINNEDRIRITIFLNFSLYTLEFYSDSNNIIHEKLFIDDEIIYIREGLNIEIPCQKYHDIFSESIPKIYNDESFIYCAYRNKCEIVLPFVSWFKHKLKIFNKYDNYHYDSFSVIKSFGDLVTYIKEYYKNTTIIIDNIPDDLQNGFNKLFSSFLKEEIGDINCQIILSTNDEESTSFDHFEKDQVFIGKPINLECKFNELIPLYEFNLEDNNKIPDSIKDKDCFYCLPENLK